MLTPMTSSNSSPTIPPSRDPSVTSVPRATYRLQLNSQFTFPHTQALLRYLADLGISDLYLSPISTARSESSHGYDVCDFNRINPDLGGETGFRELVRALRQNDLSLLLDIVPNHMWVNHPRNHAWTDEIGRASCRERV